MTAATIYHGGIIHTMDDNNPHAQAVATKNGRILAVGTLADVKPLADANTTMVNLEGNTMIPGFVEAHGHPSKEMAVLGPACIDIRSTVCLTAETVMGKLQALVDNAKPGDFLAAFGWDPLMLPDLPEMSAAFLDEFSPDYPMAVLHNSGHGSWANKKALEFLGITKDTPNPTGSEYCKDEHGELTGEAKELPASFHYLGPAVQVTPERYNEFLANEMARFNQVGVTTAGDLALDKQNAWDPLYAYATSGKATLRIRAYEMSDSTLESPRTRDVGDGEDGWIRQIGVKIWADGSPWIGNVNTSFPYLESEYTNIIGVTPGHKGGANYTKESLTEVVDTYWGEQNFQLACHAHGDVVIDMVLDVFEEQQAKWQRPDARMRLEHCGAMLPRQFERANQLGVYVSLFPAHIYYWGDILEQFFGEHGSTWVNVKGALDAGCEFSFHNDSPVTPCTPLRNMQAACCRKDYKGGVHAPELRIDQHSALKAQTIWAAKQLFSEHEVGSIEVGKFADFVILSEDVLAVDPERLEDIRIVHTISHDRVVYSS